MHVHKHQLYLLEQHSESFKVCLAVIRINTEGLSVSGTMSMTGNIQSSHIEVIKWFKLWIFTVQWVEWWSYSVKSNLINVLKY